MIKEHASGKVSVNLLNLRDKPNGKVIKVLPQFTRMDIISRDGEWFEVVVEGLPGYVSSQYVEVENNQKIPEKKPNTGVVTATHLNFRKTPKGTIIKSLPQNTVVTILSEENGWLKISVDDVIGYVSKDYIGEQPVTVETPTNTTTPSTENFHFQDKSAVTPDGVVFGTKFRKGIYHYGQTNINDYISANRSIFPNSLNSCLNVMIAASDNEGKYEAINTWDNSFLSFGIFQWTCGPKNAAGELPALLEKLQEIYPGIYQQYFGQYGLQTTDVVHRKGNPSTGYFSLDGEKLDSTETKNSLRTLPWAYRFWSAGHDDKIKELETLHAIDRIAVFYRQDNRKVGQFTVADYVNSEYGVALLLDQHVNRPGHVPKILANAVSALKDQLPIDNPQSWSDAEEALLIKTYLRLRKNTSMTHSDKRAKTIYDKVEAGVISDKRGSFKEVESP